MLLGQTTKSNGEKNMAMGMQKLIELKPLFKEKVQAVVAGMETRV